MAKDSQKSVNRSTARTAAVGWLASASAFTYLLSLKFPLTPIVAAVLAWLAIIISWPQLSRSARQQSSTLLAAGMILIGWSLFKGTAIDTVALLGKNLPLLSMFVAVSFLSLTNPLVPNSTQPRGRKGVLSTLLTSHLLGSVINISIIFVVGDRLARHGKLKPVQAQVMMRSFCSAAFWSPFFVAIGVAMTYAPGSEWRHTVFPGLIMTLPMFAISFIDAMRKSGEAFEGYPLSVESLFIPFALAIAVLVGHALIHSVSILTIITIMAPIGALLFMRERPRLGKTRDYVETRLANISSQFALFLTAGVFSTGISSLIASYPDVLSFEISRFSPLLFFVFSAVMMIVALFGIHPVVSIALVSPFLAPVVINPSQLAFLYLTVWGIATGASPLSGVGLAIVGRYHVPSRTVLKMQLNYMVLMWLCSGLVNMFWFG